MAVKPVSGNIQEEMNSIPLADDDPQGKKQPRACLCFSVTLRLLIISLYSHASIFSRHHNLSNSTYLCLSDVTMNVYYSRYYSR